MRKPVAAVACVTACVLMWPDAVIGQTVQPGAGALLESVEAARQKVEKDEPPRHTGLKALVFTTAADFKNFPQRKSTWVILGAGAVGAALAYPADESLNAHLAGSTAASNFFAAGQYLGNFYVQLGSATALYLVGRYVLPPAEGTTRTNKVSHLGFDMVRALVLSQALTQGMKYSFQRDRPTGECCAFPSGHASATFATAAVIERHLGYRASWPMFLIASYVATSRLHDNRHFLSDVVFGSALGIASGWTVVGRHGRSDYTLLPAPTPGGMMVVLSWHPRSGEGTACAAGCNAAPAVAGSGASGFGHATH